MAQTRMLVGEIPRIVALDSEPVLRNLLITQCYHDLSAEIARVLGDSNVNWCTFATWASRTAGSFIRNEEVPALLRKGLEDNAVFREGARRVGEQLKQVHPESSFDHGGIVGMADEVILDVSRQIALGNLKVFSELAPVFASFITLFEGGSLDEARAKRLVDSLEDGPSNKDGQSLLKEALEHFFQAARTDDPKERATQMLIANAKTGLHEQIRLQPFIAGSLNAPIDDVLAKVWREKATEDAHESLWGKILAVWDRLGSVLTHETEKVWGLVATKALMTLKVPGTTLYLGHDLPPVEGEPLYPEVLRQVSNEEAVALMEHFGALDPDAKGEVGADDWTVLAQRMKYIIALFRSRQQRKTLYDPPFASEQHVAILDGKVPSGDLG